MRIIKNQKGFSLTEILIAVGLMGGVSLITMKLVDDQSGNEKQLRASAEVNKAVGMIQGAISGDASCKNMLGNIAPSNGAGTQIQILKTTFKRQDGQVVTTELLREDRNYGAFFTKVGDIRFVSDSVTPPSTGTARANLVLTFRVRKKGVTANVTSESNNQNDKTIVRTLPVEYKAGPGGVLLSCGPVLSEANELARKKFCASLDPNEDPALLETPNKGVAYWNNTTKKCNLNSMDCPYGQVPKEMTSLGGIHCVPLENAIDPASLNELIDTSGCTTAASGPNAGVFSITATAGGKLKVTCP